jgi:hypothetical protein
MLLGLDFMPLDQILNVSLNGFRKQVATHHKTLTGTQMDEPSLCWTPDTILQLGEPLSYDSISHKMFYLTISRTRVFLSKGQCNFCTRGQF